MMPMYSRIVGLSESVSVFVNKSEPCFARKWCWRDNCVSLFADALVVTCAAQAKDQILTSACCLVRPNHLTFAMDKGYYCGRRSSRRELKLASPTYDMSGRILMSHRVPNYGDPTL